MKTLEIHARLAGQFGEAIGAFVEPENGDPRVDIVDAAALPEIARFLRDEADLAFDYLKMVTCVDFGDRLASVYHLYSYKNQSMVVLRVDCDRAAPRVPSVVAVWPAAEWHERECFDMMGIVYEGHEDLRRIYLPEDWEGHPLLKDYEQPKEYHGISND